MADGKFDLPEDLLPVKPSDGSWASKHGSFGVNEEDKGHIEHLDDLKDQSAPENVIPLSPQWLYTKQHSENRFSATPMDARAQRCSTDHMQKDRWHQEGSQDKDWRRATPDIESNHRWRDEERETGLLGRRERRKDGDREIEYRKNDRRVDSPSVREAIDTRIAPTSERRHELNSRNSGLESRRDSKWSSRWGPENKEDPWTEKRLDGDKEDGPHDKQTFVISNRSAADSDSRDKWRPRYRQEAQPGGSTVYRAAPGFALDRGHVDGSNVGFAPGRGRSKAAGSSLNTRPSSTGPIGFSPLNRNKPVHGKSGLPPCNFRYPRARLLDIYRGHDTLPMTKIIPNVPENVPQITTSTAIKPLAFITPDTEEEAILDDIRMGKITSSEVSNNSNKDKNTRDNDGLNVDVSPSEKANVSLHTSELPEESMNFVSKSGSYDGIPKSQKDNSLESNCNPGDQSNNMSSSPGETDVAFTSTTSQASDFLSLNELSSKYMVSGPEIGETMVVVGERKANPCTNPNSEGIVPGANALFGIQADLPDESTSLFDESFSPNTVGNNEQYQKTLQPLEQGIPPEELTLFYRDPQGEIQGPFLGVDIISWFEQGFFGIDLPVCPSDAPAGTPFQQLGEIMPRLKVDGVPEVTLNPVSSSDMADVDTGNSETVALSLESFGSATTTKQIRASSESEASFDQADPIRLPMSGDSIVLHHKGPLQTNLENSSSYFHSELQGLQDFAVPDAEEVLYSGKPDRDNPMEHSNIFTDLSQSPSGNHFLSGEMRQTATPQKLVEDNGLHPLGLLWSELEGNHPKRPLSSIANQEHRSSSTFGHDPLYINNQHASYGALGQSPSMHESWPNNHRNIQQDSMDSQHLSLLEQEHGQFNLGEQFLVQQLQRQLALQKNPSAVNKSLHLNDPFLEHLQALQQQKAISQPTSSLEERILKIQLQQQRQLQIQQQQQFKQQQQFHQLQLLQQQQHPQAHQMLIEQMMQSQEPDFGSSQGNPFIGGDMRDQLFRQRILQELKHQSLLPSRHDLSGEQQLLRAKFGHSFPHEQNNELLEMLSHPKHRQMHPLDQHLGLQQEQLHSQQLPSIPRQFPVMEEEGPLGVWSVDESGRFVRATASPLQSRSSGLGQLELLQRQHRQQSLERQALADRNFSLHERMQSLVESNPQPFDRSISLSADGSGLSMEHVNTFSRLQGLEMQEQLNQMHPSNQVGKFPTGIHSYNHHIPDQFTGSSEDYWPESNGQPPNSLLELKLNQLRLDAERKKQDFNMNKGVENPNSLSTAMGNGEKDQILMDILQNKFRSHPTHSLDMDVPPFSSHEMSESWKVASTSLDPFNIQQVEKSGMNGGFPGRLTDILGKSVGSGERSGFGFGTRALADDGQYFPGVIEARRTLYSDSNLSAVSSIDTLNLLEEKRKHGSKGRMILESEIDQTSYSVGAYNFDMGPGNSYDETRKERVTITPQGSEISSLKRVALQVTSPQEAFLEPSSRAVIKGKLSTNSSEGHSLTTDPRRGNNHVPDISIASKKDIRYGRAGSDADATEASFVDMLKSTKKPFPQGDSANGPLESGESGQAGKGGKKKGKKGRQIDPSLLGFKVHSNRIMMGEIQRLDD